MLLVLVVTVNLPRATEGKNGKSFNGQKLSVIQTQQLQAAAAAGDSSGSLPALAVGRLSQIADQ
jgi:hypothetical protein